VLSESPYEVAFVRWWLTVTPFDGSTGRPGLPEWPRPGGTLRQYGKVVEAVSLLRAEWPYVTAWAQSRRKTENSPKGPRKGQR